VIIHPANLPLQRDFDTAAFRARTQAWLSAFPATIRPERGDAMWIYPGGAKHSSHARLAWGWKLYLCLSAASYWPGLVRLICRLKGNLHWKFYLGSTGYRRPDKIIFYARDLRHLGSLIQRLRPLIRGYGYHALRFAAVPSELGLERRPLGGLFVGCDPRFLKTSWRTYRGFCEMWAAKNRERLESSGGETAWFRRMNLSTEHEGPATLHPATLDRTFIVRNWRTILSEEPLAARAHQ